MSQYIGEPGSQLFRDTSKYRFTDALNALNYALLVKLATPLSAETKVSCLAPVERSTDAQLEWRKAMFVHVAINILNAGGSLDSVPDACSCDEFADHVCVDQWDDAFTNGIGGNPGDSGLPDPYDDIITNGILPKAASDAKICYTGAIGDLEDFYDYSAEHATALAAFALLGFTNIRVAEYYVEALDATDKIGDAGIDETAKLFRFTGAKTAGQTVNVKFCFEGVPS